MSKSLTKQVRHEIEDTLDDAVKMLKRAAEDLSDDAEKAVAQAADALRRATEALTETTIPQVRELVGKAGPEARELAGKAAREVKEHPVAPTVAALAAAAALIQILGTRRKKAS